MNLCYEAEVNGKTKMLLVRLECKGFQGIFKTGGAVVLLDIIVVEGYKNFLRKRFAV